MADSRGESSRRKRLFSAHWPKGRISFIGHELEIFAVITFRQAIYDGAERRLVDEACAKRYFLKTGDLQSLPMLDGGDVVAGLEQACLRAGIEPGHAAGEQLHVQLVSIEIHLVQIRDLQLAARRWFQLTAEIDHPLVINVEPRDREVTLRMRWLLFETDSFPVGTEFNHAVAFRIAHLITEDVCAFLMRERRTIEIEFPVEDVVAENERGAAALK